MTLIDQYALSMTRSRSLFPRRWYDGNASFGVRLIPESVGWIRFSDQVCAEPPDREPLRTA
jgi:hypothetical protein